MPTAKKKKEKEEAPAAAPVEEPKTVEPEEVPQPAPSSGPRKKLGSFEDVQTIGITSNDVSVKVVRKDPVKNQEQKQLARTPGKKLVVEVYEA